jgi:hypothetical protein
MRSTISIRVATMITEVPSSGTSPDVLDHLATREQPGVSQSLAPKQWTDASVGARSGQQKGPLAEALCIKSCRRLSSHVRQMA